MPISVSCACGHQFRAKDQYAGKTVKCPKCGKSLVIAGPSVAGYDVFLSYSSKDKPTADAACAALEARGLRCWVAPRDIIPGKEWGAAIVEGIEQSRSMVLVFSANANTSGQVMREVERAVHREMPIIPFRIEDVPASKNMEYFISCHHWMDAFQGSLDGHLDELAQTVRSLLAGRGTASQPAPAKPSRVVAPPRTTARSQDAPGSRRSSAPVLLVALALLIVGGGAAGIYVWSTRAASKHETGQETQKEQQIAHSVSTEPSGTGKVRPSPTENGTAIPAPVSPTEAYSEDFRTVELGAVPKGWKCDPSVALFKGEEGPPYLHATKEGSHALTTPNLGIRGDFYVECEFELGTNQALEVTLLGMDGAQSLPVKVDGVGSGAADVHFPDSAPGHLPSVENTTTIRFRLERERNVYRMSLNGKPSHARRLRGFSDFAAVRFTLPGPQTAKLFAFRAGPLSPKDGGAAAAVPKPDEAFTLGFREDFKKATAGDLPPGWEGDDAVGVRQDGGRPRLEGCLEGNLAVKLPPVHIHGDFFLECEFELNIIQTLEATLIGRDGAPSLPVKVEPGPVGGTQTVSFPDGSTDKMPGVASMTVPLRIERKGELYRISLNNKLAHAGKFESCGDFERVQLTFSGGTTSAKVYSIRIGPLSGSK